MKNVFCFAFSLLLIISNLFSSGCVRQSPLTGEITTETDITAGTEPNGETLYETETTDALTETGNKPEFTLDLSVPLTAQGVKIHTFKCPESDYVSAQGCCFDGENWVVAFNKFDKNRNECTLLCKFDKDGKLVKTSDGPLYLEHANNITYLPEISAYYVTSCQGTVRECWNGYSVVDKDSLEITEKGELEQPFFAMSYCPERKAYASARWGGETLDFWDSARNLTLTKEADPPGTLSQGVFAAEDSVWFVRSSQNGYKQEFRVYDWEGELITTIPLYLKGDAESESVNIVDGVMYVTSNAGYRAYLYRVQFNEAE